ncbi:MAG: membrane protein insertase YidC [Gammaproteobacteria bacterium]|nr:membrane protein insertase YidC [Gammaproteobacteria bacterium]
MDIRRVILYSLIAFVMFSLWNAWNHDYPAPIQVISHTASSPELHQVASVTPSVEDTIDANKSDNTVAVAPPIEVETDVLKLKIDLKQGDIVSANLLQYPESLNQNTPFQLLSETPEQHYVANSMLISPNLNRYIKNQFHFKADQARYQLAKDQNTLVVKLAGKNQQGLSVVKTFSFTKGSYLVDIAYLIKNEGSEPWSGLVDMQLARNEPTSSGSGLFQIGTYTGASYSQPGVHRYEKVSFSDMVKKNVNVKTTGGWIAMQQHYFLTAWIPSEHQATSFYTQAAKDQYTIGAMNDLIQVKPGQQAQTSVKLFLGPEATTLLKDISPGLDLTVDYGWFWFISSALFSVMKLIEGVVGNWGWSIIIITILIKLVFYRLSAKSYHSMANMRNLQPKLEALKARHGDDKAKLSQATMELYKQEKINPLGGCLPIIVQIPVFIALYWVLVESVELRQTPFIWWINDLAAPDAFHVLPIIMGFTMLIQQRLNPAPPDPMQAKMMMFLPILFTGLFWNFPSGLVLYWIVNNILSILQQWWITRKITAPSKTQPKLKKLKK